MGRKATGGARAPRLAYIGSVRANLLALESYAPGLDAQAFATASDGASGAPRPAVAARLALSAPAFDARDAVCGRDFVTVLVVREPLERIHSHFQNIAQVLRDEPDASLPPSSVFADADAAGPPRFAARWLATRLNHVADNLYVRTLLGRAAYDLPFGAVGPAHERAALEVLQAIDWVLPLSNAGLVLAEGLGWRSAARAHLETTRKARRASRPSTRTRPVARRDQPPRLRALLSGARAPRARRRGAPPPPAARARARGAENARARRWAEVLRLYVPAAVRHGR